MREHLGRILESELFRRSDRLSRFLEFSVQAALNGDSARVKEYVIGVEVFDRGQHFDPRIDPVVRVEARRLRTRLKQWHDTVGQGSALTIELPSGSYAAEIRQRAYSPPPLPVPCAAKKIAVLPFANLNGDPELDYFSDGLTEELIHGLTRVKALHVVAWSSASRLKGQEDLATIRDRLQVENILRGTVRRSGDRLRMTAQLIDAADGHYLWSEAWDRAASDLMKIEQEIAQAIVDKLRVDFEHVEGGAFLPRAREPESHTFYLKGRFQMHKRSEEGLRLAVSYFSQAAEREPDWALAWAGLADAYALMATYGVAQPAVMMRAARETAKKALHLDPTLAEALTCLAFVRSCYDWEWREAEELYRRAIALSPGYAVAHHWYATDYLVMLGRFDEAAFEIETAISLDPLSSIILDGRALILMVAGRYEEARQAYLDLLQHDPLFYIGWSSLGRVYTQMGRYAEAIEMYQKARALVGDFPKILGALGQTLGLAGQVKEARELLDTLEIRSRAEHVGCITFSLIHLGLGERDAALMRLETAVAQREISVGWLKVHPAWNDLRSEPRFHALLKQLHFA